MQTFTFIPLVLAGIILLLAATVAFLVWRMARKNDELRRKNKVIIRKIENRHRVIDIAVRHGVSRAALL